MEYTYKFLTDAQTVEIDEQWVQILAQMDREEQANNKAESRRHLHMDAFDYEGEVFSCDDRVLLQLSGSLSSQEEMIRLLPDALAMLSEDQKALVKLLFMESVSARDIAAKEGVTEQAIHNRKNRLLKRLKKILLNGSSDSNHN